MNPVRISSHIHRKSCRYILHQRRLFLLITFLCLFFGVGTSVLVHAQDIQSVQEPIEKTRSTTEESLRQSVLSWLRDFVKSDWASSVSADLVANLVLAGLLYFILTKPNEKRMIEKRRKQLLGMLKSEFDTNLERVNCLITLLRPIEDVDSKSIFEKIKLGKFSDITSEEGKRLGRELPRKYTRGVWNALKEAGFITQLDDPQLVFYLLRANEALVVAEGSRKTLRRELLSGKTDVDANAHRALADSQTVVPVLVKVLDLLNKLDLPQFISGEVPNNDDD